MKFKIVTTAFNDISSVSARLQITNYLADLFKRATPKEARIISYLSLGILRPSYLGSQFNFAKKILL